jgi:CRP/FNR family transcriptional regulator, dissimilatory nitrate respiration regulator
MDQDSSAPPTELLALLPRSLHSLCVTERAAKGDRLFEAGKTPSFMHFVESGEVTLQRHGIQGEPIILQRTRHGFVGEASLQSARYHCDAIALAKSVIVKIPLADVRPALQADSEFSMRWVAMLNREVKRLRLQCERLTLKTVQARLLHLIEGEDSRSGYPLDAGLKSVAQEIGVSHEALYRCVAALELRGVLCRTQGRLQLISDHSESANAAR